MDQDKLQFQRFEMKYLVSEEVALAVRDFVSSYLVLDKNCVGKPRNSYRNHSLYLDSEDLRLYWDVINGNKNRYKLRVRFYEGGEDKPVFFEVKRRSNDAMLKQRAWVRREAVAALLAGHLPGPEHLFSEDPTHLVAVQCFSRLMQDTRATPKTHVAYLREAWMPTTGNSARVTLDREVCCAPHTDPVLPNTRMENPAMPWGDLVILELKFTGRFPNWFGELVRVFGARQCGVAKYAEGVAALGEGAFHRMAFAPEQGDALEQFLRRRRLRTRRICEYG
jgi:hypothetical protein